MDRVGFIGLGTMGLPMAGHLLRIHGALTVWNRTPGKSSSLEAQGAVRAADLAELARNCDTIIICVNRSEDVQGCIDAMKPGLKQGQLIIDHSTIAPHAARAIYADLAIHGIDFVDAPITGGSMGANAGTLTIFCGGNASAIDRAKPLMAPYTKVAERVGDSGSGQMMKLANQVAVGGALQALCECFSFAEHAGLDLEQAKRLIGGGAGGSWAFENYGPKILNRDWTPGFSIKNQRKDFGYVLEAATQLGVPLPGTILTDTLLAELEADGRGEDATVALFDILRLPEAPE